MTYDEAQRLASATHILRPDWHAKSLLTFIQAEMASHTYREAAVQLAWIATDPDTRTPKRVLEQGPWVNATRAEAGTVSVIPTRCGDHPNHKAATCPECTTVPPADPSPYLDEMRAAIRSLSAERRRLKQGAP